MILHSLGDLLTRLRNNDPALSESEQTYSLQNQKMTDSIATELAILLSSNRIIQGLVFTGTKMNVTKKQWEIILNGLIHHPTISRLGFEHMVCNGACARHLVAMFRQNQLHIKQLYFRNNMHASLTNQIFIHLLDSLRENCNLESLEIISFINDDISDRHRHKDALAQSIRQLLQENATIQNLDLSGNNFANTINTVVGIGLNVNSSLISFKYSSNYVDSSAAIAFANAFRGQSQLSALDLSWNEIGDDGMRALIEVLQHNDSSLQSLSLGYNNFSAGIIAELATALRDNTKLQRLEFDCYFGVTCSDYVPLINALRDNTTLRSLEIPIEAESPRNLPILQDAIREMLEYNDTITHIEYGLDEDYDWFASNDEGSEMLDDEDYDSTTSTEDGPEVKQIKPIQSILLENKKGTRIAPLRVRPPIFRWLVERWVEPNSRSI